VSTMADPGVEAHRIRSGRPPAVWGDVPPRNPDFIGREDLLRQLHEQLLEPDPSAELLPQALHGLGGVGKSQLAIGYAYRHMVDFDIIWWIPGDISAQIGSERRRDDLIADIPVSQKIQKLEALTEACIREYQGTVRLAEERCEVVRVTSIQLSLESPGGGHPGLAIAVSKPTPPGLSARQVPVNAKGEGRAWVIACVHPLWCTANWPKGSPGN
jgi:hypothetical protein